MASIHSRKTSKDPQSGSYGLPASELDSKDETENEQEGWNLVA